ncbi:MAG TPA: 4-(cytidine 5'-diphospho)-2-C-methyl-D-erythritol kinase [Nocardioidaceae bacterium]|nr:4-(cytidine 5'-diphospho)-2-C-methyl-D-erythritol kinase [Nocardioidaceae bacterium]
MRPDSVVATAPAKINLCLGVGPVRDDGYHPLATVYQAVGLFDEVTVAPDPGGWTLTVQGDERLSVSEVPTDDTNLAMRAGKLLAAHHGVDEAVRITLDKGIPVAGGLAGGSADAAATLVACDALWGARTPRAELLELAAELGSDVPFALVGGTAIGSARGEVVTPAMTRGSYWWVVLESSVGLSTPKVYREFDIMHEGVPVGDPEIPDALMAALRSGDIEKLGASLANDLQPAALRLRPDLEQSLEYGREGSAHGAIVSGSGPSCLFLTEGRAHAQQVAGWLKGYGLGPVSFAPGPVPGARVIR